MITIELTEKNYKGILIGKEVYDCKAKRIGIVRSILLKFPPLKAYLLVQNGNYSLEIAFDAIQSIGHVIQLSEEINLGVEENLRISKELKSIIEKDELLTLLLIKLRKYTEIREKLERGND